MSDQTERVVPLEKMTDFKVAEGDPDVRGWGVVAADGSRIGEVDRLLVDVEAKKVRYLDVDLDEDIIGTGEDRHALIPIGFARLDQDDDRVLVDAITVMDARSLPAYTDTPVTRDHEVLVRQRFDPDYVEGGADAEFYDHRFYDDREFYSARRVDTER